MEVSHKKKSHHHGDLREALVAAGIELLNEGGLSALTLRKCAGRAGVSHAAPAHHFDGLNGLLTAIAARGFHIFSRSMIDERKKSGSEPKAMLAAICQGYLQFAQDNAALYNLMFTSENLGFDDEELARRSVAAYQILAEGCAPFASRTEDGEKIEIMIWSLVHGFAGLSHKARASNGEHPASKVVFDDILSILELKAE